MNEFLGLVSEVKIKGHCRIELRDAETDQITDVEEGYNFISPLILGTIAKQLQKLLIAGGIPNGALDLPNTSNNTYDGVMRYLVLTDYTGAESPSTEFLVPGNRIGWANRSPYAGGDSYQGSINVAESFGNESMAHWVFDFPTNCANGTINSVCWAYNWPSTDVSYTMPGRMCGSNWVWLAKFVRTYQSMTCGDGFFWGVVGTALYKIDPATYQEVATYTLPLGMYNATVAKFVVYGGSMYYTNTNGYLAKYTYATGVTTLSANTNSTGGSSYAPAACDGTYLYMSSSSTDFYSIGRVLMSTLLLAEAFKPITNISNAGWYVYSESRTLVMVGGILYAQAYSSNGGPAGTYSIDYASGKGTLINVFCGDGSTSVFLFSDGTTLYATYTESYYSIAANGTTTTNLASNPGGPTGIKNYNLMARKLLGTPITKTSAKTMKIIYEFTFS